MSEENGIDLSDLSPDPPNPDGIPEGLKVYPNWCCWEYHIDGGYVERRQVGGPWAFNVALSATTSKPLGLGFILDGGAFVGIEMIADEHDSAYQAIATWDTYLEHNDTGNGITAIAEAAILAPKESQTIRIVDAGFIPITGRSIRKIEPGALQKQVTYLVNSLFIPTWMDGLPENASEEELYKRLKTCLDQKDWFDYPIETRLYEFLARCWDNPAFKVIILKKAKEGYARKAEIDAFISAIETEQHKRIESKRKEKGEEDGDEGGDIGQSRDEIEAAMQSSHRPTIIHDATDITTSVDAVLAALIKDEAAIWQRDGSIVAVRKSPADELYGSGGNAETIKINHVGIMYLVELATRAANHFVPYKYLKNKQHYKPGSCPRHIAEHIMERMSLPLRKLVGIVTVPTMRPDGSIIFEPGYDDQTGLFYDPMGIEFLPVPDHPTKENVKNALDLLRHVFKDFWFSRPHDEAASIAAILTIMTRHLVNNAPLTAISSSVRGIGKTLLADCISIIATGLEYPHKGYPKNDEEMQKRLLVAGIEGDKLIIWDNVRGVFGSGMLDSVLTGSRIKDRILQFSKDADVKVQASFIATGVAMKFHGDITRRINPIMLEARSQNPENRTDIEHTGLNLWCVANQPRLHAACLTLLRAYVAAGRPKQSLSAYGSFEQWSDLVRSCVYWLGLPDPCLGRRALEDDADIGFDDLQTLLMAWREAFPDGKPLQMKDILDKVKGADRANRSNAGYYVAPDGILELGEALLAYDPKANARISELSVRRIGQRLPMSDGKSRIIDGLQLRFIRDQRSNTKSYWVEESDDRNYGSSEISISDYDDSDLVYEDDKESDVPF